MKLSVIIPIYRGGAEWVDCWQAIVANSHLFEKIFLSFNYSDMQTDDLRIIGDVQPANVHVLVHQTKMTATEHSRKIYRWVLSQLPEGFILFLCHDDIIEPDALAEILVRELKTDEAIFGPFRFTTPDNSRRTVIACEFTDSLTGDHRVFANRLLEKTAVAFTASGLIIHSTVFARLVTTHERMQYGCNAEIFWLCNPLIRKIWQGRRPLVVINVRAESEGAILARHRGLFGAAAHSDALLTLTLAFAGYRDAPWIRLGLARQIAAKSILHPWRSLRYGPAHMAALYREDLLTFTDLVTLPLFCLAAVALAAIVRIRNFFDRRR